MSPADNGLFSSIIFCNFLLKVRLNSSVNSAQSSFLSFIGRLFSIGAESPGISNVRDVRSSVVNSRHLYSDQ